MASMHQPIMIALEPPTNVSIMLTENGYAIYMMEAVTCNDPDCDEPAHARVITEFAEAAVIFQEWANRFLALSKVEGEG